MTAAHEALVEKVAWTIDPTAMSIGPSAYGFQTQEEFKTTMGYGAQLYAISRARIVLTLVYTEMQTVTDRMTSEAMGAYELWRFAQHDVQMKQAIIASLSGSPLNPGGE